MPSAVEEQVVDDGGTLGNDEIDAASLKMSSDEGNNDEANNVDIDGSADTETKDFRAGDDEAGSAAETGEQDKQDEEKNDSAMDVDDGAAADAGNEEKPATEKSSEEEKKDSGMEEQHDKSAPNGTDSSEKVKEDNKDGDDGEGMKEEEKAPSVPEESDAKGESDSQKKEDKDDAGKQEKEGKPEGNTEKNAESAEKKGSSEAVEKSTTTNRVEAVEDVKVLKVTNKEVAKEKESRRMAIANPNVVHAPTQQFQGYMGQNQHQHNPMNHYNNMYNPQMMNPQMVNPQMMNPQMVNPQMMHPHMVNPHMMMQQQHQQMYQNQMMQMNPSYMGGYYPEMGYNNAQQTSDSTRRSRRGRGNYKTFEERVEELRAFKQRHGHVNPKQNEDKKLSQFCANVRHAYKYPGKTSMRITEHRKKILLAIGFEFEPSTQYVTKSFSERMEDLKAFKEKHGHTNPSKKDDKHLAHFCYSMRNAKKNIGKTGVMKLTEDRLKALDEIGFEWTLKANLDNEEEEAILSGGKEEADGASGGDEKDSSLDDKAKTNENGENKEKSASSGDKESSSGDKTNTNKGNKMETPKKKRKKMEVQNQQNQMNAFQQNQQNQMNPYQYQHNQMNPYQYQQNQMNQFQNQNQQFPSNEQMMLQQRLVQNQMQQVMIRKQLMQEVQTLNVVQATIPAQQATIPAQPDNSVRGRDRRLVVLEYPSDQRLGLTLHDNASMGMPELSKIAPNSPVLHQIPMGFRQECCIGYLKSENFGHAQPKTANECVELIAMSKAGKTKMVRMDVLLIKKDMPSSKPINRSSLGDSMALTPTKDTKKGGYAEWRKPFKLLIEYKQEHGHCSVPPTYDPALAHWCWEQRDKKNRGQLSSARAQKLTNLGFDWTGGYKAASNEAPLPESGKEWSDKFESLVRFKDRAGIFPASGDLHDWIEKQKSSFRHKTLAPYRVEKLVGIGLDLSRVEPVKEGGVIDDSDVDMTDDEGGNKWQSKKPRLSQGNETKGNNPMFWQSHDAAKLFGYKKGDDVVQGLRDRIELLKKANETVDGWKTLIPDDGKEDNYSQYDIMIVRHKAQYLIKAYLLAINRMNLIPFRECCNIALKDLTELGLTKFSGPNTVLKWAAQFRVSNTFPHPGRHTAKPKQGFDQFHVFEYFPTAKKMFLDIANENMERLTGKLMKEEFEKQILPALEAESREKGIFDDGSREQKLLMKLLSNPPSEDLTLKWMPRLGIEWDKHCTRRGRGGSSYLSMRMREAWAEGKYSKRRPKGQGLKKGEKPSDENESENENENENQESAENQETEILDDDDVLF
eukprot:CAMPEP_0183717904 /NCGR_PEP_ID=MMETSP0737-20130205/11334_1 /TAXON_ID=385413 /ORGANISM="Thalassiosira miniscula, Strain CCMP1093" /LENGTH=1299 /DNA_ID=CAMNT_0025947381 /DNA_START=283 /DNA_END=4182 /DNA_ORIENTATION=+